MPSLPDPPRRRQEAARPLWLPGADAWAGYALRGFWDADQEAAYGPRRHGPRRHDGGPFTRPVDAPRALPLQQAAFCTFAVQWDYDLFLTRTYREERLSPERRSKLTGRVIARLNEELFGRAWRRSAAGVYVIEATEPHAWRPAVHEHDILGGLPAGLSGRERAALLRGLHEWCEREAGYAWIEPVTRPSAVILYTVKAVGYATKGGDVELRGRWRPPAAGRDYGPLLAFLARHEKPAQLPADLAPLWRRVLAVEPDPPCSCGAGACLAHTHTPA